MMLPVEFQKWHPFYLCKHHFSYIICSSLLHTTFVFLSPCLINTRVHVLALASTFGMCASEFSIPWFRLDAQIKMIKSTCIRLAMLINEHELIKAAGHRWLPILIACRRRLDATAKLWESGNEEEGRRSEMRSRSQEEWTTACRRLPVPLIRIRMYPWPQRWLSSITLSLLITALPSLAKMLYSQRGTKASAAGKVYRLGENRNECKRELLL